MQLTSAFSKYHTLITVLHCTAQLGVQLEASGENDAKQAAASSKQRPLRAKTVVLQGEATTFVASLDEFLVSEPKTDQNASKSSGTTVQPKYGFSSESEVEFVRGGTAHSTNKTDLHLASAEQHDKYQAAHSNHHSAATSNSATKPTPQHWQVRGLLNFTNDYPLAYSRIINGYVWPLMAALTMFTNLIIVFVLTQRDMRTPTNVVLTAIAIADIIPILVPVPWFVYLFAMGNEKQVLYPPIACYFYQHSTRSVSEIFYFLSTWLNVLLAIQDYLTACQPKLAKKYCKIRVVIFEIVYLTLLAFLLNLPQALKVVFKPVKFYYENQLTWGCKAMQAKWFKDLVGEYVALYDDIFTAIIVVFVDGGPAVVLISLTALLIRQLQKEKIKGHLLMEQARTVSKRRRVREQQQEYESSARVMIFVLLAFLAVKIPFATTYTLMIIQSRFEIHFVQNLTDYQKALTITDLVFVLSYPINFTIFCLCSKKFRHKCAQLLSECNNQSGQQSGSSNTSRDGSSFRSLVRRLSRALSSGANSGTSSPAQQTASRRPYLLQQNQLCSILEEEKRRSEPKSIAQDEKGTLLQSSLTVAENETMPETSRVGQEQAPVGRPKRCDCQQESVSSLLEDGSLCAECILRYEQIRATMQITACSSSYQNIPGGWPPVTPPCSHSGSLGQQAGERRFSQMSDTSSGMSWPVQPLAAPASLSLLQQQQQMMMMMMMLTGGGHSPMPPQIITTACESVREHSQAATSAATSNLLANNNDATDAESVSHWSATCAPSVCQVAPKELKRKPSDGNQHENTRHKRESYQALRGKQASSRIDSDFADSCETNSKSRSLAIVADKLKATSEENNVSRVNNYGRKSKKTRARQRKIGAISDELRPPTDKQRSFSLSNSNLTTLPSATGMLADVLVGTLFGSLGGANQQAATEEQSGKQDNEKKKKKKKQQQQHQ